jgi:hypothetical protein
MASWRNRAALASVVALAAAAMFAGCFNPKIVDGGLRCTEGGTCPEGFRCSADGTCKKGGPMACQPTSPHLDPICTPDPGTDCDPICQSRCDCGRCNLDGAKLTCMPPGTKQRGAVCDPDADDCAPGNICLWDCAKTVGRCYRFCGKGAITHDELCDGQACDVPVNDSDGGVTDLFVCQPPLKVCNPVGTGMDCGNDALGCYVDGTGVSTTCDCKGKGQPGMGCSVFNSCVPGYRCITIGTPPTTTCLKTCRLGGTDCPSGTCMSAGGSTFGFCPP